MWHHIVELFTGKRPLRDIVYYFEGHLREKIYNSKYRWIKNLMKWYIKEQIAFRLKVMNQTCYNQGSCTMCGCEVPSLQMSYKSCEGNCYPPLMGEEKWIQFYYHNAVHKIKDGSFWIMQDDLPWLFKEKTHGYVEVPKTLS